MEWWAPLIGSAVVAAVILRPRFACRPSCKSQPRRLSSGCRWIRKMSKSPISAFLLMTRLRRRGAKWISKLRRRKARSIETLPHGQGAV